MHTWTLASFCSSGDRGTDPGRVPPRARPQDHLLSDRDLFQLVTEWVQILARPLTGCVILGKPLIFSVPQFPHLETRVSNSACFMGLSRVSNVPRQTKPQSRLSMNGNYSDAANLRKVFLPLCASVIVSITALTGSAYLR